MNNKQQKVAIVTSASSGIGEETVRQILAAGYVVHADAHRLDKMRPLETEGARLHLLDLTAPESIDAFVAGVLADTGHIDALVNCAGYGAYVTVKDFPIRAAREHMEVNLFTLAHLTRAIIPVMHSQRSGKIVNVSYIGGKLWSPLHAWYHAFKFAVEGFSDALRNEVRPCGIDVILIEPGAVKTEWAGIMLGNLRRVSDDSPYRPHRGSLGQGRLNGHRRRPARLYCTVDRPIYHRVPAQIPLRGPHLRARLPHPALAARRPRLR